MPAVPFYYYLIPNFKLLVNGRSLLPAFVSAISQVTVDDHVDSPSMFSFVINSAQNQALSAPWLESPILFALGDLVAVQLGYDSLETVAIGEITALEPEFNAGSLPSTTVRGYDRRHRLQRGRKTRTFLRQKDSTIVSSIGVAAGFIVSSEDTGVIHDHVKQVEQTDWDFLQERARRNNYDITLSGGVLRFQPRLGTSTEPIKLELGKGLTGFYPRLSSTGMWTKVIARGWDTATNKAIVGTADAGTIDVRMGAEQNGVSIVRRAFGEAVETVSVSALTVAEANRLASSRLAANALGFIQADAVCAGRSDLRAGGKVQIAGAGLRFSGEYVIHTASHRYDNDGYSTHLKLLRGGS
jgi:uncharacterized protein